MADELLTGQGSTETLDALDLEPTEVIAPPRDRARYRRNSYAFACLAAVAMFATVFGLLSVFLPNHGAPVSSDYVPPATTPITTPAAVPAPPPTTRPIVRRTATPPRVTSTPTVTVTATPETSETATTSSDETSETDEPDQGQGRGRDVNRS